MPAMICVQCKTEKQANDYAAEAAEGTLNGVSLGTTTDVEVVFSMLVIRCTEKRATDLVHTFPYPSMATSTALTVKKLSFDQAMAYAIGKMDT